MDIWLSNLYICRVPPFLRRFSQFCAAKRPSSAHVLVHTSAYAHIHTLMRSTTTLPKRAAAEHVLQGGPHICPRARPHPPCPKVPLLGMYRKEIAGELLAMREADVPSVTSVEELHGVDAQKQDLYKLGMVQAKHRHVRRFEVRVYMCGCVHVCMCACAQGRMSGLGVALHAL